MKLTFSILITLTTLLAFPTYSSAATLTTYTDRTTFENSLATSINEGFDNFIGGTGNEIIQQIPVNTSFDLGAFNVFYNTADGQIETQNSVGDGLNGSFGSGARLRLRYENSDPNNTLVLRLDFDNPINAFGSTFAGFSLDTDIVIAGESVRPHPLIGGGDGFLGITSDTAFTSLEFIDRSGNDNFFLDDAILGNTAVVPVPPALLLFLSGLGGLTAFSRYRKRKQ